jgi:hypothetical protein
MIDMSKPENIFCRVCGYEYLIDNPTWHDDETPSNDICVCCGVQFGYEDCDYESVIGYRKHWLGEGAKWFSRNKQPKEWTLETHLKQIQERWK